MRSTDQPPILFDRRQLRRQRRRAAPRFREFAVLESQIQERIQERLAGINRTFGVVLDIGTSGFSPSPRGANTIACDLAADLMSDPGGPCLVADEELLPFAPAVFDLVLSRLSLHWANDLPGALVQIRRILHPDGLFIAALLGGDSLHELRRALTEAELELTGGASARVSPFADIRDLGDLLQRAGFAMPVADLDRVTFRYKDIHSLMRDLRGSGNASALAGRQTRTPRRRLFARAGEIYKARYGDRNGLLPATFDVIFLTAWAPGPDQPVAKKPGSATHSLADALPSKQPRSGYTRSASRSISGASAGGMARAPISRGLTQRNA